MTSSVERVELPGIGFRSTFPTAGGVDVGVLEHNTGHREVLVYSQEDPDQCASVVRLDAAEAQAMADLLGVATAITGDTLRLGSLVVRVAVVHKGSGIVGQSPGPSDQVSVVGIIRNEQLLPTTAALLEPGDNLLLTGPPDAVASAVESIESRS